MQTTPLTFTISIRGSGNLRPRFHHDLMTQHPKATVYDRDQEMEWNKPSSFLPPTHQEVADIDVFFRLSRHCDEITLRCRGQHRLFRFNPDHPKNDEVRLKRFLQSVVDTVEQLLIAPSVKAPELPGESEATTETLDQPPETS